MKRDRTVDRSTLHFFWRASLLEKRLLFLAVLYPIGAIALATIMPLIVGKILAALAQGTDPMRFVPYFIGVGLVGLVANRIGFAFLLSFQAKVMSHLQLQAFSALLKRSMGFHNNNVGGKLVSDAIDFPTAFALLSNAIFLNLIPFSLILIVGSVAVILESWLLGAIIAGMALFTILSAVIESNMRAPVRRSRQKVTKQVTGHIADSILNVQTVKTFAKEHIEAKKNQILSNKLRDLRVRDWSQAARLGNNRMAILTSTQLLLIIIIIHLVGDNPALLGIGIFAFSFTITMSNKLFEINGLLRNIEDGLLQASTMTEILLENPEIVDAPHAKPLEVKKGSVNFSNVSFQYEDESTKQEVFSGLELSIKPGEKIGLVGPSGGGKSTLTRLLLRFEDVTNGTILIDDQDVAKVTQESLRQSISYVPQEPLLFHRTIKENISYGHKNGKAVDDAVRHAAKLAHADEFIAKLPNGYDTIVGERGVKLSGGQRQRIAIARAILKDAPILVLDEATSALDSESEVLIQSALWELMQKRTTIVIAHRLSTIQKMDRIIVLNNAAIAEEGTHKELIQKKGIYAKLWSHQSGGFLEEE